MTSRGESSRRSRIPEAKVGRLSNGLTVLVSTSHGDPYVNVRLRLPAGGIHDPKGREGVAAFCAHALRHGTRRWSEQELSEALDGLAVRIGATTYHDNVDIGADATTLVPGALDLLFDALEETVLRPTFPGEEVDRIRSIRQGSLTRLVDQNDRLVTRTFEWALMGGRGAGRPLSGTMTSLAAIDREALVEFWSKTYTPRGSILAMAGDISFDQAMERAERHFGTWEGPEVAYPSSAPSTEGPGRGLRVVVLDKRDQGLSQIHLRLGHLTPVTLHSPEYPAYRVATKAFGGDFTARLNQRLRVKEGLTYGARYSYNISTRVPGSASAATYVETDKLPAAISMILDELDEFRANGPTMEEISFAKDRIVLGYPFRFESPSSALEQHVWARWEGLGDGFLASYQEVMDSVPPEQVIGSARVHFPHRGEGLLVVVGNQRTVADMESQPWAGRVEVIHLEELGLPDGAPAEG